MRSDEARNAESLALALSFASAALEWARTDEAYALFALWAREQKELTPPTREQLALADTLLVTMAGRMYAEADKLTGARIALLHGACASCLNGHHHCDGRRYPLSADLCACAEDSHLTLTALPPALEEIPDDLRDPS